MELAWQRLEGRDGHSAGLQLLAQMVDPLPPIRKTSAGKPYFVGSDVHFSISHTERHIFCCVSSKNVGIDAEEAHRTMDLRLAERWLSEPEMERYLASPDRRDTLLRLWVLKESYAKLTSRGIGNYLKNTNFDPNDPRITQIDGCYVAVMEE